MSFLKTPIGIVVGVMAAAVVLFGTFKGYQWWDEYRTLKYDQKTASAEAHGDSAKIQGDSSLLYSRRDSIIRIPYAVYIASREVQSNPTAKKVAGQAATIIATGDTALLHARKESAQLRAQVADLESRGTKPGPRAIPYVEPLYVFSNKGSPRPSIRVGVDYRIFPHASAKLEVGYEPPSAQAVDQRAEFRLVVGGRVTFR